MHRLISILLASIILYNNIGYYIIFKVYQSAIRYEAKERVFSKQNLTIIKYSASQKVNPVEWESAEEFTYNNVLYDLVGSEQIGDTINLYCQSDLKESYLVSEFKEHVYSQNYEQNKEEHKSFSLFKLLQKDSYCQINEALFFLNRSSLLYFNNYCLFFNKIFFRITVPPPQIIIY